MTNTLTAQQAISVDANEIFAQFGLGAPATTQNVSQIAEQINVGSAAQDASYEDVTQEETHLLTDNTEVNEINDTNDVNDISDMSNAFNEFDEPFDNTVEQPAQESSESESDNESNEDTITLPDPQEPVETENSPLSQGRAFEDDELTQLLNDANEVRLEIEEPEESVTLPFIPVNSKSTEVKENTSRFSSAAWFDEVQKQSVIVAGQGGIGGYITFLLSRMNPRQIFIYDDDDVEFSNLSGQLYSVKHIGQKKVNAIADVVHDFSNYYSVMTCPTKFTSDTPGGNIMISGFDNMEARYAFFNVWIKHIADLSPEERKNCLYIDARLAAEEFQVFCFTGNDNYYQDLYLKKYMFRDYQALATTCSYKQTSHCAMMVGSIVVNLFTNFIANTLNPVIPRDLPFKTYYDASLMFFKTES